MVLENEERKARGPRSGHKVHYNEVQFEELFEKQRISKNHFVRSKIKYPFCTIQEKGRVIPTHIQDKVLAETHNLASEGHISKLGKYTSDFFSSPTVLTVKKDDTTKLALDAKPVNSNYSKTRTKCQTTN